MALFAALPRRDTKPFAKSTDQEIRPVRRGRCTHRWRGCARSKALGDAALNQLKLLAAAASRVAKGEVKSRNALSSWNEVIDYCRTSMAFADKEQFRLLFLDKRNQLIADEVQQTGTVDHTPVYPREVIKRALELSATALILVHNHPSGDPTPSQADIQMTKAIIDIANPLGIAVHDHIIVGNKVTPVWKGLEADLKRRPLLGLKRTLPRTSQTDAIDPTPTSALRHPGQAHALNRAVAPGKESRIVAPCMRWHHESDEMVKLGSSASPACAAARASSSSPRCASAVARRIWRRE